MDAVRERKIFHDVSWDEFERRLAAKHDKRVPLFAYLDGTLELMSPSFDHEQITRHIELLLVQYLLARGIACSTLGSATLTSKLKAVGIEPDDCYFFGDEWRGRRRPDLAVEVVWTRGGIRKLEIYRRFNVPEVWIWKRGAIAIYRLRRGEYRVVKTSRFVPGIDLALLCSFLDRRPTTKMILDYRAALDAQRSMPEHAPARRPLHVRARRRR